MNDDKKNDIDDKPKADSTSTNTVISDSSTSNVKSDSTNETLPKKLRKIRKDKGIHHNFKNKLAKTENKVNAPIKLKKSEPKEKNTKEKSNVAPAIIMIALAGLAILFLISVIIPKQKIEELKQKIMGRREFYE